MKSLLLSNTFSNYSFTRNGKAGWYKTFRNHILQTTCKSAIGDSIVVNFSKFNTTLDKHFSKFNTFNFTIEQDKIQKALWHINNLFLPPSLKCIVIHCGTNNSGMLIISDGFVNLSRVIGKKCKCIEVIINSLLPRDKANSQKLALAIATNIYLKEIYNSN